MNLFGLNSSQHIYFRVLWSGSTGGEFVFRRRLEQRRLRYCCSLLEHRRILAAYAQ